MVRNEFTFLSADGKTPIHAVEWLPEGAYYRDAVERVQRCELWLSARGVNIAHRNMVWCQGCTDGDLHTDPQGARIIIE